MMAFATRFAVSTQVASSCVAPRPPAMCGKATLAMELSRTSMNVASVTVMATIHGLMLGLHGFSIAGARDWPGANSIADAAAIWFYSDSSNTPSDSEFG